MKILIVSPVGEDVHIRKIPAALVRQKDGGQARWNGVEVTVAAPERVATEPAYAASGWLTLAGEEQQNGFRLVPLELRDPQIGASGFDEASLHRLLHETQPDVIQIWGGAPDEHVAQAVRLMRRVCRKSKVVQYGFNNLPIRWRWRTRLKWRSVWRKMAGALEANSEGVQVMREAGFRQPMERIFWGVALDECRPMDRAAMRRKLGLEHEHVVGYVGRFVEEKGLRVLLDALERLPESVHAVLIGSGPLGEELQARGQDGALRGRVHVFGTMPAAALAEHMNCFDALALPSLSTPQWKEQYGRVLGEAMACGVVVVGSDSGAIPEVIGEAGLVAPEGDAAKLADALCHAVSNEELRARLIPAGMNRAIEELSVEAMSGKLMDFYGRLLGA